MAEIQIIDVTNAYLAAKEAGLVVSAPDGSRLVFDFVNEGQGCMALDGRRFLLTQMFLQV